MEVISREKAEHYVWGDSCDGWRLVRDSDLGVIGNACPLGRPKCRTAHRRARQFSFVLSGRVLMETDGPHISLCIVSTDKPE